MKTGVLGDFLLCSNTAKCLYDKYAKEMPIFDYHSHVDVTEIYKDRHFENITQLWLEHDHYKWRLMRLCGVDEFYITGDAEDRDKFLKFAEILPLCIGNPVYLWCHMELKKYFGFDGVLDEKTAPGVWSLCENELKKPQFSVRNIIRSSDVTFVGTTDDPCDTLQWHKKLRDEDIGFTVAPTFRPDLYLNIEKPQFCDALDKLSNASGVAVDGIKTLKCALRKRMNYFAACGCISADHGCDYIAFEEPSDGQADKILKKAMSGGCLSDNEIAIFKTLMTLFCADQYAELGWVMQIHYNCIRNPNEFAYKSLGTDKGFDCIRRGGTGEDLSRLIDKMSIKKRPKLILYSLDGTDDAFLDTLVGSFACGEPFGRIMHGAAWWFNDTCRGISNHLHSMSSLGVLGNFTGMLTDSRSFLSYVRHDYFRRILCLHVANMMDSGQYLAGVERAGEIIKNISYCNAEKFFGMESVT
ncbi:MAG: glucuronate isomerase [Ruminococcaceae bacterium]|nr:glucuronate isomerase [Oscillospiraceae bacterium]